MEQKRCLGCMKMKSASPICEHCGYDERTSNEPHQLQAGTVLLGKYLVGRVLGQGGFGITYLGWNRYLETIVAIKEYYPSTVVDRNATHNTSVVCRTVQLEEFFRENRMRFLREAQTLAKLQGIPQIVSVYDFYEVNNTAYIVMEYLRGEDLRAFLQKRGKPLTPTETFNIMRPTMAALAKIHDAGMVHRDISPDNIMLLSDGSVKLMDFGSVRNVNHPGVDKELTQATQAIVKHGFAPMEQYSEKGSIGPWTDEYALCATMYYCMTGKLPENAPTRILEERDLDWDQIPGLTEHHRQVLAKGMAIRAKDRYPGIRELMNALFVQPISDPLKAEHAKAATPQQEPQKPQPPKQEPQKPQPPKQEPQKPQPPKQEPQKPQPPKQEPQKPESNQPSRESGATALLILALVIALLLCAIPFLSQPHGWTESLGEHYYYQNGEKLTGWQKIDGQRYFFDNDGRFIYSPEPTRFERINIVSTYGLDENGEYYQSLLVLDSNGTVWECRKDTGIISETEFKGIASLCRQYHGGSSVAMLRTDGSIIIFEDYYASTYEELTLPDNEKAVKLINAAGQNWVITEAGSLYLCSYSDTGAYFKQQEGLPPTVTDFHYSYVQHNGIQYLTAYTESGECYVCSRHWASDNNVFALTEVSEPVKSDPHALQKESYRFFYLFDIFSDGNPETAVLDPNGVLTIYDTDGNIPWSIINCEQLYYNYNAVYAVADGTLWAVGTHASNADLDAGTRLFRRLPDTDIPVFYTDKLTGTIREMAVDNRSTAILHEDGSIRVWGQDLDEFIVKNENGEIFYLP